MQPLFFAHLFASKLPAMAGDRTGTGSGGETVGESVGVCVAHLAIKKEAPHAHAGPPEILFICDRSRDHERLSNFQSGRGDARVGRSDALPLLAVAISLL